LCLEPYEYDAFRHCREGETGRLGMVILDNYIVRIYRRDKSDPDRIVGIVEDIASNVQRRFTGFTELSKILVAAEGRSPRKKRGKLPAKERK